MGALSHRLLPILRERIPDRGFIEGQLAEDPCAAFPGLHPGIRQVAVYDDGDELTVALDDLTHGHFSDYDHSGMETDREQRIVDAVVEFLVSSAFRPGHFRGVARARPPEADRGVARARARLDCVVRRRQAGRVMW